MSVDELQKALDQFYSKIADGKSDDDKEAKILRNVILAEFDQIVRPKFAEFRREYEGQVHVDRKQLEEIAWYCIDCERWHPKGMTCAVHEIRNLRKRAGCKG